MAELIMLSRTAAALFWMARYIERAENLARMLEVTYRTSLLPESNPYRADPWEQALDLVGVTDHFKSHYGCFNPKQVIEFLVFSHDTSVSLYSCLRAARENARTLRGVISSEMWENLNDTWLEFRKVNPVLVSSSTFGDFCDWVKNRSHLFRGVTLGTAVRDEGYTFLRLGTMIERADNTARMLNIKYDEFISDSPDQPNYIDYYYWASILRTVSAYEVYRKVYRDKITPERVCDLLILNKNMPRSVHGAFEKTREYLAKLEGVQDKASAKLAAELSGAFFTHQKIEQVFEMGVNNYLTEFIADNAQLANQISEDFLKY